MTPGAADGWSTLASETLCETPYVRLSSQRVATPSRPDGVPWVVAHRSEATVIAPRTNTGNFLLIRQERVAVKRITLEFPAGQIDGEVSEAAIRATALRELGEETGMECRGELIPLGSFYSSVGFTDEHCHLFLATDVAPRAEGFLHDEHEVILEVKEFTPAELRAMVASGEIIDSNTLAVFARLSARNLI